MSEALAALTKLVKVVMAYRPDQKEKLARGKAKVQPRRSIKKISPRGE